MNKVLLMGRLTRDPDIRSTAGEQPLTVARYTLAVDRKFKQGEERKADFISCVCFGKSAEFAEKYLRKGVKLAISGRIQTGSYQNKDGQTVYTTDVIVEEQEFAESKNSQAQAEAQTAAQPAPETHQNSGFMPIPDGISEDELPFGG